MGDSASCPDSPDEDHSGDVHNSFDEQATWDVQTSYCPVRGTTPSTSGSATPPAKKFLEREEVSPIHRPALPALPEDTKHCITTDLKTSWPDGWQQDTDLEHTYDDGFLGELPLSKY